MLSLDLISLAITSCGHWWLAWGKWNATWFIYKLFYWHLSAVETLMSDYVRGEMFIHVYFTLKLVVKEKFIQRFVAPHQKSIITAFIVWISWKKWNDLFGTSCVPNWKTCSENFRYEYVYCYVCVCICINKQNSFICIWFFQKVT